MIDKDAFARFIWNLQGEHMNGIISHMPTDPKSIFVGLNGNKKARTDARKHLNKLRRKAQNG